MPAVGGFLDWCFAPVFLSRTPHPYDSESVGSKNYVFAKSNSPKLSNRNLLRETFVFSQR